MEEELRNHRVQLLNRKEGLIIGVKDVCSFDVEEVMLETNMGRLQIKGKELHVKRLNLERGEVEFTGEVSAMIYQGNAAKKNGTGIMGRLFS